MFRNRPSIGIRALFHLFLEVKISWQVQHFVNLHVQISWQAQHFGNLHVQISWQVQHFVNLHVQISWQAALCAPPCADFVAGATLCEPPCADFVAGAALCEPPCADFVAGAAIQNALWRDSECARNAVFFNGTGGSEAGKSRSAERRLRDGLGSFSDHADFAAGAALCEPRNRPGSIGNLHVQILAGAALS